MEESTQDREKYTIDEMLDTLQSRAEEEDPGRLVTRSDGSQAIKVRKRKRRTEQTAPKTDKKKQKAQILQVFTLVGIIVLFVILVGVGVLYSNSKMFRTGLAEKAGNVSGGKVSISEFRMNPVTANAGGVEILWPEGNPLSHLSARIIKANIKPRSFLGKVFKGEEILAVSGELLLSAPKSGAQVRTKENGKGKKSFQFNRYSIPSLKIFFGDEASERRSLAGTEVSFYPGGLAGAGEIRLQKGVLKFEGWPELKLDRSFINVREKNLDIKSMRFEIQTPKNQGVIEKGFIDLSGVIRPMAVGETHTLSANIEFFDVSYLLGDDLGPFFSGDLSTQDVPEKNFFSFTPSVTESAQLHAVITNSIDSQLMLSNFSFLSKLALVLDDSWYENPLFDGDVSIDLRRKGDSVWLKDINLAQRDKMAVRGEIKNGAAGGIDGVLHVGIPDSRVSLSPNLKLQQMFGEEKEGFRWIELQISGTASVPIDNFRELYENVIVPNKGDYQSSDSFDVLIESE